MPGFDQSDSEIRIYVQRTGLLKRIGHDLELRADEFEGEIDPAARSVTLEVRAAAVHVVSAVERRVRRPALSRPDAEQIDQSIAMHLEALKFREIVFRSSTIEPTPDGYSVRGTLRLHGHTRELEFSAARRAGRLEGEVRLHQPDFGIEPFRALGGALKLEPDVAVVFSLPEP